VIDVKGLTVKFGGVVSLNNMTVTFPTETCGLIGPNGAGKTTFFNVMSGFVTPVSGQIICDGVDILAMPHFKRARWGLRRTFQTEQAIESLTLYENVLMVQENSDGHGSHDREAVMEALDALGLAHLAEVPVGTFGARERRFVEVARAVVGKPRVVLLDEPAAGLPDEETEGLRSVIAGIPERTGATVILVDHDMALVQGCCTTSAVLDFGSLLASGPTGDVLRDPRVMEAYLGIDENAAETNGVSA
jgi:branched-chain amino acid transport system ATP-binding protein